MAKSNSHYKMSKPAKRMLIAMSNTPEQKASFKKMIVDAEVTAAEYRKRPLKKDKFVEAD